MEEIGIKILDLLLFPESYHKLKEESSEFTKANILGDVLKGLLHNNYVQALIEDEVGNLKPSLGFDSDRLQDYHFQITSKGLKEIS